jgi:hypothetical protein
MSLSNLFDILWRVLRGDIGGIDFVAIYSALGAVLWAFLLFKAFLQEGLQIASGRGTELPKILVKYLFVAAMFAVWPMAANRIFWAIKWLASIFFPSVDQLLDTLTQSMAIMGGSEQAGSNSEGLVSTVLGVLYNFTIGSLLTGIGIVVLFLCYALIMINIAGSITILLMNLVIGPVFFALAFDREFRSHAMHWFAAVLSYFMLIPLYGAALYVAAAIAGAAIPMSLFGLPSGSQMAAQLFGPLLAVGVVFSTNKVINALVGGAAGSGLGSMALGAVGASVSMLPGGALVRSTAVARQAAVNSTVNTTKSVSSKLSSTARSAINK